jgi:hypothetical protein
VALDIDAELRGGVGSEDPVLKSADRLRAALRVLQTRLLDAGGPPDIEALEADLFAQLPELLDNALGALPNRAATLGDLPTDLKRRYLAPDGRARVEVFSEAHLSGA